jgi:hypothetical protein
VPFEVMPSSQFAPISLLVPFEIMSSSQFAPIFPLVPFDLLSSFQFLQVYFNSPPFYVKSNSQTHSVIEYLQKIKKVLRCRSEIRDIDFDCSDDLFVSRV